MAGIDNSAILLKADYQFKGPLTENYVLQQLRGQFEVEPRYYSDKPEKLTFCCKTVRKSSPWRQKAAKTSPRRPLSVTLQTVILNTHFAFPSGVSQGWRDYEHPALSRQKNKRAAVTQIPSHTVRGDCLSALMDRPHDPQHPQPRGGPYIYASPRTERFLPIAPTSPPHKETVPPKHPPNPHCPRCGFWGRFFPDFYGFSTGRFLEIR